MVSRAESIEKLKQEHFDILIIGGGATGSGIAIDAATRGLKVGLVEYDDFASGTSSRSTKLIHGGVRYLERAFKDLDYNQFHLVAQALKERYTLLHIAPHLTRSLPIVIPVYSWFQAAYYLLGMKMYEILAGKNRIGTTAYLSKKEMEEAFPNIAANDLKGGVQLFDGQFDDAKMNVAIILTAMRYGAVAANHAEALGFEKSEGAVTGVLVKDRITEEKFVVKSKVVVNASGPMSDKIRKLDDPYLKPIIAGSVGTHIVLDGNYTHYDKGLLIPRTEDGRVLFLLPWKGLPLWGPQIFP